MKLKKAEIQDKLQLNSVFTVDKMFLLRDERMSSFMFKEFSLPSFVGVNDRNLLDRVLNPQSHFYVLNYVPYKKQKVKLPIKSLKIMGNVRKKKPIDLKLPSKAFEKTKRRQIVRKYKLESMTSISDVFKGKFDIKTKRPSGFDQQIIYRSTTDNFARVSVKNNVSRTSINNHIPKVTHYKSITEYNKRRYTLSKLIRQRQTSPGIQEKPLLH